MRYIYRDNALPLFSVCKGDAKPEYEECVMTEAGCNKLQNACIHNIFPYLVVDEKKVSAGIARGRVGRFGLDGYEGCPV